MIEILPDCTHSYLQPNVKCVWLYNKVAGIPFYNLVQGFLAVPRIQSHSAEKTSLICPGPVLLLVCTHPGYSSVLGLAEVTLDRLRSEDQGVVKTAFFMIGIILSVFSIPLYIIKRGKLKKIEKMRFQLGGWLPEKISAPPFGQK